MPLRRNRRASHHSHVTPKKSAISPTIRLWMLRVLVPLGGSRQLIKRNGFSDDNLAAALGMGQLVEACGDPWDEDPRNIVDFDFSDRDEEADTVDYDQKRAQQELRRQYRIAERKKPGDDLSPVLRANFDRLTTLLGLSEVDIRILELTVMINTMSVLTETVDLLGNVTKAKVYQILSVILDLPEDQIRQALAPQGSLASSGLLIASNGPNLLSVKLELLSEAFAERILAEEMDPVDLLRDNFAECSPPELSLDDYDHINTSLKVMVPYLRRSVETRRQGVNIFLYGQPGTGKSQLARVLAHALGCDLFQVACENAAGDPVQGEKRLRAFRAAQSILSQRKVMIVFDEAEDVFDDGDLFFGRKSTAQTQGLDQSQPGRKPRPHHLVVEPDFRPGPGLHSPIRHGARTAYPAEAKATADFEQDLW